MACMETATCEELDSLNGCRADDGDGPVSNLPARRFAKARSSTKRRRRRPMRCWCHQCSDGKEFSLECLDKSNPPNAGAR